MGTSAADLLIDLTRRGIELVAQEDRLRYRPRSAVTPDLAGRLRTHKAELLAILRLAASVDSTSTSETAPVVGDSDSDVGPSEATSDAASEEMATVDTDAPATSDKTREQAEQLRGQLGFPEFDMRTSEPGIDPCYWCGRFHWWRSIHGVVVCGNCHPPAVPQLVAEWIAAGRDRSPGPEHSQK